ncbi:MAG: hypothetical protein J6W04_04290 [Bacteroidales bacterium]|nr:hypothetical protein [Bacteroidales bacterium]
MANVNQIAYGLLKNPMSRKWREEYAKLSEKDREDVKYIIDQSAMGSNVSATKFKDFWKYVEEMEADEFPE